MPNFNHSFGVNQPWSFRCCWVSTASQNLHRKGGLKMMLIVSWSILILASVLSFIIPPAFSPELSFGFFIFALSGLSIFSFKFLLVVVLFHRERSMLPAHWLSQQASSPFFGFLQRLYLCLPLKHEAKRPSIHVAPNSGSIKLGHELSDLLC